MTTNKTTPKSMFIGGRRYVLPFRANGYWVEDATGDNVAEARNAEVAKDLAKTLNMMAESAK